MVTILKRRKLLANSFRSTDLAFWYIAMFVQIDFPVRHVLETYPTTILSNSGART